MIMKMHRFRFFFLDHENFVSCKLLTSFNNYFKHCHNDHNHNEILRM